MRKDKIELHFYREGMVLNSKSTSVDIMRWDFSVVGAKAYVLQLSENVRRSTEQKNKNGEITGLAPLGYENYINERGKKFVRPIFLLWLVLFTVYIKYMSRKFIFASPENKPRA